MSDLALIVGDTTAIDLAGDPATFVVLACERAKSWLTQAVEHGDIDQIVELKSQAEAIRIYTAQKQLGKDAELAAAEIVRRAERGIGVCIRRGQEEGTIRRKGQHVFTSNQHGAAGVLPDEKRSSPAEIFGGGQETTEIYALTDNISNELFDEAIDEAKDERNLSRANVVRKVARVKIVGAPDVPASHSLDRSPSGVAARVDRIKYLAGQGNNSRQIADDVGIDDDRVRRYARLHDIPLADDLTRRTRRIDSNRIISEAVSALEGIAQGVELIDADALDPERVEGWVTSLGNSLRSLNRLNKQLREVSR